MRFSRFSFSPVHLLDLGVEVVERRVQVRGGSAGFTASDRSVVENDHLLPFPDRAGTR
jgi:hypothetical protein